MFLMVVVLLLAVVFAALHKFVKEIALWLSKIAYTASDDELDLRAQIRDLKDQQLHINMADEFARYMKIQRQIDKLVVQVKESGSSRQKKLAVLNMGVKIGFYILHALVMLILVATYRSEPLLMLANGSFFPIQRLVAFPSGVSGGVGIVCWIVVCNSVVFRVKNLLHL